MAGWVLFYYLNGAITLNVRTAISLDIDLAECVDYISAELQVVDNIKLFGCSAIRTFKLKDLVSSGGTFFDRAAMIPQLYGIAMHSVA